MTRYPWGETLTGAMLGLLALALVAVLTGCHGGTGPAVRAADATRATGHALAAVVDEVCTRPAQQAAAAGLDERAARVEVERLERLRCPEAWAAQTALSEAHAAMVALVAAHEARQCHATVAAPAPARCDLARATLRLVEAAARLARAVDALRAEVAR